MKYWRRAGKTLYLIKQLCRKLFHVGMNGCHAPPDYSFEVNINSYINYNRCKIKFPNATIIFSLLILSLTWGQFHKAINSANEKLRKWGRSYNVDVIDFTVTLSSASNKNVPRQSAPHQIQISHVSNYNLIAEVCGHTGQSQMDRSGHGIRLWHQYLSTVVCQRTLVYSSRFPILGFGCSR